MKNWFWNIKGDVLGGVTAGIVGLPLCLAFGATSGLGPVAGLYGGIILGFLAAIFGGTKTLVSAPTGPMTVVASLIVAAEIQEFGDLQSALGAIFLTFSLAGVVQIILGLLKLGKYINYLPYPVISGFMSGIGVIVIAMQFRDFFGAEVAYKGALDNFIHLPEYVMGSDWRAMVIAAITLITVFFSPKIIKGVPGTLIGLAVGTAAAMVMGFDLRTIGAIPQSIPDIHIGQMFSIPLGRLSHIILPALTLGGLGMIDSLLTSVIADKLTKTKHNSNRELIGQGIGNIGAALFGGLPGAGTTVVTVTNTKTGARTQLSGVVQALFLLAILLFGAQYAAQIPYAVLAGLLISIGFNIMDYTVFQDFKIIPKSDRIIIVVVFFLTVTWSLLYATAIGFLLASLFFMRKMADTIDRSTKESQVDRISHTLIDFFDDAESFRKDVYIKILKGPVFFGFASRLDDDMKGISDIKALILDFKEVPYMDQTGLYSVRDGIISLKNSGIDIYLTDLNEDCHRLLVGAGILNEYIDEQHVFPSIEDCIIWSHDHIGKDDIDLGHELEIPSAFTPNGDGMNDFWAIGGIEHHPTCRVVIFDDRERVVYQSVGYKEPWGGMYKNSLLPNGKYIYEIQLNHERKISGKVVLVH